MFFVNPSLFRILSCLPWPLDVNPVLIASSGVARIPVWRGNFHISQPKCLVEQKRSSSQTLSSSKCTVCCVFLFPILPLTPTPTAHRFRTSLKTGPDPIGGGGGRGYANDCVANLISYFITLYNVKT